MPPRCRCLAIAVLTALLQAAWLEAQVVRLPPVTSAAEEPPGRLVSYPDSSAELPQALPEAAEPENPDRPPDARDGAFQKLIFSSTWLDSGGNRGFGMVDLELRTVLGLPIPSRRSPLVVTPGFAVHYLDGPMISDLPARVYDATVQFRWWKRFTPRFGIDFAVTPGVFGDFEHRGSEAFRIPGHVAARFEWTPRAEILFGAAYLDRDDVAVLPVGGLIWRPRDDWSLEMVAPRPRIARRVRSPWDDTDAIEHWVYLAGEFGGGTWAIRRAEDTDDVLTYRDFRAIVGVERKALWRLDWRLELGYVFERAIEYAGATPDVEPSDTVMLRGSLTY